MVGIQGKPAPMATLFLNLWVLATAELVKENSFFSLKSLTVICISMCMLAEFYYVRYLFSLIFVQLPVLLVNAVNFPGTTRPFSS